MAILWEATSRHIERALRHDDVAREIIRKELKAALDLWTCTSWQDLVDEAALRSWEEARQNIFLRLAKSSHICRMPASELPVSIFGEADEGISLMAATRQLRRAAQRWREMSGEWQKEPQQPSWNLTRDQWCALGGAQQNVKRVARLLWDNGIRDVRTLMRESLPMASRPSLPQHLLFLEENVGSQQDTTFRRTEGGRSGTQETKVWAPRLKQLRERDSTVMQDLLNLTDWRGLLLTATSGTVQRPTGWAITGRTRGSVFKVTTTGPTRGIPSRPQLEKIKRFIANSLMIALKSIQMSAEEVRSEGRSKGDLRSRFRFEADTERQRWRES